MKIRERRSEDTRQIIALAERHQMDIPEGGKLILAENDKGEIKAMVNVRLVMMIEPFISESPAASVKLWNDVEAKIKEKGIRLVRCFTDGKNEKLFNKVGFFRVFRDKIIMEKIFPEVENGRFQ